jgi:periplasmic divalent cation tolerance protein
MATGTALRIIYIPCGSEDEARSISRALIERGLVACANIYPSRSIYRWKGEWADEVEHVVFAKTTADLAAEAAEAAEQLHSYEIPCVIVLVPTSANEAYVAWVTNEVRGGAVAPEVKG